MSSIEDKDYFKNCTWKKLPDTIMIELTNSCNFACVMCSNKHMTRKKGFITVETFKKALDRCVEANIESIKLYTTGESLLHPKFIELWNLAANYPFKTIQVSTNGSLLTEEVLREILKSDKARIQFSFAGWDKPSYESRYACGNFENTLSKIRLILKLIEHASLPKKILTINGIITGTTGGIEKTKRFLKEKFELDDEQISIHNANNWADVVSGKNERQADKKKSGESKNTDDKNKIRKRYYCHIANTRMGILYDGTATACGCLDVNGELIVGNINDDGIEKIRTEVQFKEFINKLDTGNVSSLMCRNCDSLKWIR